MDLGFKYLMTSYTAKCRNPRQEELCQLLLPQHYRKGLLLLAHSIPWAEHMRRENTPEGGRKVLLAQHPTKGMELLCSLPRVPTY